MDGELAAPAGSAATTVVKLMATDAWGEVKEKIGGLWRRFRSDQADAIAQELDRAHVEIAAASETITLAITREWESRLLWLLAADPGVAAELSQILATLGGSRPAQQRGNIRQTAKASRRSTVIQVGGDATIGELPLSADPREERL